MADRPDSIHPDVPWAGRPPVLVSGRSALVALLAVVATALVFGFFPGLDLAAARVFYLGQNRFAGQSAWGNGLRHLFYWAPFAVFAIMLALFLAGRAGRRLPWTPSGRDMMFLLLSLAVGPGLLVNTVLKDHSHRPRPIQVAEFGGTLAFRPFYTFDGACAHNCSFVSGEGSAAVWTVAPALLVPPSMQPAALAGAIGFGAMASLLRMAFGGHFLSDTIFAGLFTWLVIIATWWMVFGIRRWSRRT